jgi:hypothetical protein
MEECGEMMGIQVLDHIIIGDEGYISLRKRIFFVERGDISCKNNRVPCK